jgi:hypothetical protein
MVVSKRVIGQLKLSGGQRMSTIACMIPDRPLTGFERLAVGITTGGAFRKVLRDATASFENGELLVRGRTDVVAGSASVVAARMPVKDVVEVRITPIDYTEHVKAAFLRSLVWTCSIFATILIMVMIGSLSKKIAPSPQGIFGVGLVALVMGCLFSFLPAYSKIEKDLIQVIFVTQDNKGLLLAIRTAQKETAVTLFRSYGLKIAGANRPDAGTMREPREPDKPVPDLQRVSASPNLPSALPTPVPIRTFDEAKAELERRNYKVIAPFFVANKVRVQRPDGSEELVRDRPSLPIWARKELGVTDQPPPTSPVSGTPRLNQQTHEILEPWATLEEPSPSTANLDEPFPTKTHISMGTYRDDGGNEFEGDVATAVDTDFGLLCDLQMALRRGIEQLEAGLTIVDADREQTVASGRIDITARDKNGSTVVIELKAGPADLDAIAQILSYMGDLTDGTTRVRGIVVAREFSSRAIAAARAAPNVRLVRYGFQFSFEMMSTAG